jgi:tRNA(Ile)-lysidine synthase
VSLSQSFPAVAPIADPFVCRVESSLMPLLHGKRPLIVLALSGGPDSCALLASLKALSMQGSFSLLCCHVNHGLRGRESDEDEAYCAELCRHWQVGLEIKRLTGADRSEAALREGRYAALIDCAESHGAQFVATAHNLDDQVETVLFRMFRGSAPGGLLSVPEVRRLSDSTTLIRPMLRCERQDVAAFLSRIKLSAREDSSNRSTEYDRNYIRNAIIPAIRERFPSFQRSVERMRTLLQEDSLLMDDIAWHAACDIELDPDTWSLQHLDALPISIKRRLVAAALRARNIEVTFDRAEAILELAAKRQGALSLDQYWDVRADKRRLQFQFAGDSEESGGKIALAQAGETELEIPGLTVVAALSSAVQIDELDRQSVPKIKRFPPADADEALVDLGRASRPLVLRARRPGDTIRPFGMDRPVKLKKFLHTHKTSASVNPLRSIVVADAQEVLWIPGVGISERLRVTSAPTHHLRFMHVDGDI